MKKIMEEEDITRNTITKLMKKLLKYTQKFWHSNKCTNGKKLSFGARYM